MVGASHLLVIAADQGVLQILTQQDGVPQEVIVHRSHLRLLHARMFCVSLAKQQAMLSLQLGAA